MRRRIAVALLAAAWTAGCQELSKVRVPTWPPRPVEQVDEIVVRLSPPMPLNWDGRPGADGLQTQVHFFRVEEPLSVTVRGALELSLYEGRASPADALGRPPLCVWRYEGPNLEGCLGRSIVGWGYGMRLGWDRPPPGTSVTLLARYEPPGGPAKFSEPLHLAIVSQ